MAVAFPGAAPANAADPATAGEEEDMAAPPRAVVFDAIGTLFDPAPVRARLDALGAPPAALAAWLHRTLHAATALTLAGRFHPLAELAERSAATLLAQLDLDPAGAASVAAALGEMEPHGDAAEAIDLVAAAGATPAVLTNGAARTTAAILARAGLAGRVATVVSVEEVQAYKPDRRTYARVLERLGLPAAEVTLVAAHGWDCAGAQAAGLGAVWVSRMERRWPMPGPPPPSAGDLPGAVRLALAAAFAP